MYSKCINVIFVILTMILFMLFYLSLVSANNVRVIKSGEYEGCTLEYFAGEIIVKIRSLEDSSHVKNLLAQKELWIIANFAKNRWGVVGYDTSDNIFEKIETLKESPLIEWCEPNIPVWPLSIPNDSLFPHQWGLNDTGQSTQHSPPVFIDADIDAPEAWEIQKGNPNLMIGVLDTGFPVDNNNDLCHADLDDANRFIPGFNCTSQECDSADESSIQELELDHGGPVTGIIAAEANNTIGLAGVIWYGKIFLVKIWPGAGQCGSANAMAAGIEKAVECGAKILNISIGDTIGCFTSGRLEEAVDSAYKGNTLIVASAGNSAFAFPAGFTSWGKTVNDHNKCCYYDSVLEEIVCEYNTDTCGYRNVIAAGAMYRVALPWSSAWSDDSLRITVLGPGSSFSTYSLYDSLPNHCEGYGGFTGTSAAAPHITGIATLLLSEADTLKPSQIRALIENNADDLWVPGWDDSSGHGKANALRALMALQGYYPNASGHLKTHATWKDTIYMIGDVVVLDSVTLTIDSGTVIKVLAQNYEDWGVDPDKCELIVNGKLRINGGESDSVTFCSAASTPSDTDWYGIRVTDDDSASAFIEYANIKHAYKAIHYYNSASDTIKNCHFYDNQMYGIYVSNSNLVVLNNLIEKSSYDDIGYGIYTQYSPTIWGNHIKNYRYGIYATGSANPTLERNKITNGRVGLYCYNTNSVSIDSFCFQGWFEDTYVKADKSSTVNIDHSYMEGDSTSYGAWYILTADGTIRRSGIFNYQDYGIYGQYNSNPDLGTSGSHGDNSFEGLASASRHVKNEGIRQVPIIDAVYNWWGTSDPPDSMFENVFWEPDLGSEPTVYDACTNFSGPKIVFLPGQIPEKFSLSQNYPNPFNPTTVVRFTVNGSESMGNSPVPVILNIYNILGQKVKTLVNESKYPGTYEVVWDGKDEKGQKLATGIYFYQIKTDNFVESRKMLLLK